MNPIEIGVLTPDAARRVFAETWHAAEAGQQAMPRLVFGCLRELFSAITEKRLDPLRQLGARAGLNVRQRRRVR